MARRNAGVSHTEWKVMNMMVWDTEKIEERRGEHREDKKGVQYPW